MPLVRVPSGMSLQQASDLTRPNPFGLPLPLDDGKTTSGGTGFPDITMTTGAVGNIPSSWVQGVSSLASDVGFIRVTPTTTWSSSGAATPLIIDIGTGGIGSEVMIIDSINCGFFSLTKTHPGWMFPVFIPRGTAVSARIVSPNTLKTMTIRLEYFAPLPGVIPSRTVNSIGADRVNSRGTIMTAPGSSHTKGAWVALTTATTEPYAALGVSVSGGNDATQSTGTLIVDIGVGAAGAERVIIPNVTFETTTTEIVAPKSSLVYPAAIPAGSRLSARWQGDVTGGNLDVIVHGIRPPR